MDQEFFAHLRSHIDAAEEGTERATRFANGVMAADFPQSDQIAALNESVAAQRHLAVLQTLEGIGRSLETLRADVNALAGRTG